ncbi:hypothetical protein KC865_02785 [Candidatus Kaiserbacteria bacterium]|nr:hypothetical protein [Candidatus Kaiserbacteria bacterium]
MGVGLGTNPRLATLYYQPSSDEDCVNLTFSIGLDGKTYSVFLQGQEKMPKLLNLFKELGAEETETELHTNIFNWKIHMPFGSISEVFDKICLVLSG